MNRYFKLIILFVAIFFVLSCNKDNTGGISESGGTTYSVFLEKSMPNMVFECREYDRNGYEVISHSISTGERFLYADDKSVKIEVYAIMTTKTGRCLEKYCCQEKLKIGGHVKCRINNFRELMQWWDANYEY